MSTAAAAAPAGPAVAQAAGEPAGASAVASFGGAALVHTGAPAAPGCIDSTVELAELFARVARRLRRAAKQELSPLGLTWAQARVLRLVYEAPGPLRMADIAGRLEIVARSATTMVDALAAAGLVTRGGDPDDRRSVLVALAPAGRTLVEHMDEARRCAAAELFGRLDGDGQRQLLGLLEAMVRDATESATPMPRAEEARPCL